MDETKLDQARSHYIQSLTETLELYGLSPSMGLLYGTMLFQDRPLTLDEMCQQTGMSKTSMSTGVRELSRLKLVKKKWERGVRKDLYEAEHDLIRAFIDYFVYLWEQEIEINKKGLVQTERTIRKLLASGELTEAENAEAQKDLEKVATAKIYYAWLHELSHFFQNDEVMKQIQVTEEMVKRLFP
ncbi:GbsR/MarR family transcriptional regulator [Fodinisporobacter ferrooxydans]|uniref:HTH-type transcriptional regulator n=1 Tax=Fodinisporobacter ferrooxydans TaxID=2901836 RepID=A0ABY4CMG1_9BACL|nr:GbsR/MarR family transcriptional regulator [Alicyclobacillaceae bacterium MYW30-H2]